MAIQLDLPLYRKQYDFVNTPARFSSIFAGRGYGKSHTGAIRLLLMAMNIPDAVLMAIGPTHTQLNDSTKKTFYRLCPPEIIAWKRDGAENSGTGIYNLHGGVSEIMWRSGHNPGSLRGPSVHGFWLDEAGLMDEEVFDIAMATLRLGDDSQQRGWITTTPVGDEHWTYKLFGEDEDGRKVNPDPMYQSWFAETKENTKGLSEGTIQSLYAKYSGPWAAQELGGRFVRFSGLVYPDFKRAIHVIPRYDDLLTGVIGRDLYDPNRTVDLAWDFGYPRPEAVLAIQQDGYGNIYVVDEVYRLEALTEVVAAEVKERPWFPKVRDVICDSASQENIKRLQQLGLPARGADKGRIEEGIKLCQETFQLNPQTAQPRLLISSQCENLLTELKKYKWKNAKDGHEPGAVPIDEWNHALDAYRYWVRNKWRRPTVYNDTPKPPKRTVMPYQRLRVGGFNRTYR